MRTKPKAFSSGNQLFELYTEFCEEIVENGYKETPTQTAFCRWLGQNYREVDRKTIYNSVNKYFPDIKKRLENMRSDIMMEGGLKGKYNPTMCIFGLKNWCGWKDKLEAEATVNNGILDDLKECLKDAKEDAER